MSRKLSPRVAECRMLPYAQVSAASRRRVPRAQTAPISITVAGVIELRLRPNEGIILEA